MSEFKGTKGKWTTYGDGMFNLSIERRLQDTGISTIAVVNTVEDVEECKANAKLIADAGNVRQMINCDLPELLKQRNEMLDMLKNIASGQYIDDFDIKELIKETTEI